MPCVSWTRTHAAEYINEIGQAVQAAGGRLPATWLEGVLHRLKHLAYLAARYPSPTIQEKLTYLQKREAHMQFPTYQQAGWPIGSGSVESANKLVVEARLKGAGMRWGQHNVNPMLVLRNAVCNRQWHKAWATSVAHRRALRTSQRQADSQQRLASALWFLVFGEYRCIGCLIYLFLFPLQRRLRPSRSDQFVVLVLAIPGANPLRPPLRFQERHVQKMKRTRLPT